MGMTIDALAKKTGTQVLVRGYGRNNQIDSVYASDRMSDLLSKVSDSTLLITSLVSPSVVRLVELMDVPAICLLNGAEPSASLMEAAKQHRTTLLVSPDDMEATSTRFRQVMDAE